MQMTLSPTLQLKKPAAIICDVEGDDRCGQCENVLFRTCLRVSTSRSILGIGLGIVASVLSFFNGCSSTVTDEVIGRRLFVADVMVLLGGDIDSTYGHVGLRCE